MDKLACVLKLMGRKMIRCVKRVAAWYMAKFRKQPVLVVGVTCVLLAVMAVMSAVPKLMVSSKNINLRMANIGELATRSAYTTNVEVISEPRLLFGWEIPFTRSEYIFSYDCEVKAGIDFDQVEINLDRERGIVTVKMPQARVFSSDIVPESLHIYDNERNVFTPLTLEAVNEALLSTEEEAENTAVANGIIDDAQEYAKTLIRAFVMSVMGDKDVNAYTFVFEIVQEEAASIE